MATRTAPPTAVYLDESQPTPGMDGPADAASAGIVGEMSLEALVAALQGKMGAGPSTIEYEANMLTDENGQNPIVNPEGLLPRVYVGKGKRNTVKFWRKDVGPGQAYSVPAEQYVRVKDNPNYVTDIRMLPAFLTEHTIKCPICPEGANILHLPADTHLPADATPEDIRASLEEEWHTHMQGFHPRQERYHLRDKLQETKDAYKEDMAAVRQRR